MEPSANQFRCPLCNSIDAVTKVSSIVDGGSATSIGYHAAGRASGTSVTTSTTALANKLAPPSLPRFRLAAEGYNGCAATLIFFMGLCLAAVGWLTQQSSSFGSGNNNTLISALMILFGVGWGLFPIVGFIIFAIIRSKKRPAWKQACAMWEKLYYCARNDVVFVPGTPQLCVPTSQISALIYPPQI